MLRRGVLLAVGFSVAMAPGCTTAPDIFAKQNLVAWCIVPFDANERSPAERAEMVRRLGLRRVAYDWRAKHVATFEDEIVHYQKRGIEFFAFWSWHDAMEPLHSEARHQTTSLANLPELRNAAHGRRRSRERRTRYSHSSRRRARSG